MNLALTDWDNDFAQERVGRVAEANGTLLKVTGLLANIGELYALVDPRTQHRLHAEVVGLSGDYTLMMPLGNLAGVNTRMDVIRIEQSARVPVGREFLGRVINAMSHPVDTLGPILADDSVALNGEAPLPFERTTIEHPLPSGVTAIDTLLTIGLGQRVGIFAPAGGGKSTLLGMLTRGSASDVNIIVLVGERGREVREFIEDNLDADTLAKTCIVVSTADRPAMERCRAVLTGIALAEYFRDQGKHVVFMMDSVTRYARALREVGIAVGEPAANKGFPPSVYATLPRLFERAGSNHSGTITSFFTVLLEDEHPGQDPIGEEVRSLLDGHILLSSKLAAQGHYPAIDVLRSASRVMTRVIDEHHMQDAIRARQLLAKYEEVALLIQLGEYQPGHDGETDAAVQATPAINRLLQQRANELATWDANCTALHALFGESKA